LISFLTFQISMFFSASLGCCSLDDMVGVGGDGGGELAGQKDFLVQRGTSGRG
jgi:hypothetical protein